MVTLDEIKTYLGIELSDTSWDDFLTEQIAIVTEAIEAYCSRRFQQGNYVETFYRDELEEMNGELPVSLSLYCFPAISVSEIKEFEDDDKLALDEGVVITSQVRPHLPSGSIRKKTGVCQGFFYNGGVLRVTYSGGYATIPAPVLAVLKSVIEERYNKKKLGIDLNFGSNVQRISIPGSIAVDYDYSLDTNDRKSAFGVILGNNLNVLDYYRSERAVVHSVRLKYFTVS